MTLSNLQLGIVLLALGLVAIVQRLTLAVLENELESLERSIDELSENFCAPTRGLSAERESVWLRDSRRVCFDPLPRTSSPARVGVNGTLYLVSSPESSGNRYMVKMLIRAGCSGVSGHFQPLDYHKKGWFKFLKPMRWSVLDDDVIRKGLDDGIRCFVLHRSLPHASSFVSHAKIVAQARRWGIEPRILTTVRSEPIVVSSQLAIGHVEQSETGYRQVHHAYVHLFRELTEISSGENAVGVFHRIFPYTSIGQKNFFRWFFQELNDPHLPLPPPARLERFSLKSDQTWAAQLTTLLNELIDASRDTLSPRPLPPAETVAIKR